jgi:hypothetical protein
VRNRTGGAVTCTVFRNCRVREQKHQANRRWSLNAQCEDDVDSGHQQPKLGVASKQGRKSQNPSECRVDKIRMDWNCHP